MAKRKLSISQMEGQDLPFLIELWHNPAAIRVYEKAGFLRFTGMRSWHNHQIMELGKERFRSLYPV